MSVSGAWSGVYRYPYGFPDQSFRAHLTERDDGVVIGQIEETDDQGHWHGGVVYSHCFGERFGSILTFTKVMENVGPDEASISYEAAINASETRIEGAWRISGSWSGGFVLQRQNTGTSEGIKRSADVTA